MIEIHVFKARRQLEVRQGEVLLHNFPIAIGRDPIGPKEREGDNRTPEGRYRVCAKNPKSRFYLSVAIDYPNAEDARRGLAAGRITAEQCAEIEKAHRENRTPPWKTALGGEIYLHGHLEKSDATQGCIQLRDPDMDRIFALVEKGTAVFIHC